jgi:hypothetical protein
MALNELQSESRSELEQAVRRRIVLRTAGRIRALEVAVFERTIVVRGHADNYYTKQLALHGALDVLGDSGELQIALHVDVNSAPMSTPAS